MQRKCLAMSFPHCPNLKRSERHEENAPRQVYIRRKVELTRYGFAEGCPGCNAAKGGAAPTAHRDAVRKRIEAAIIEDDSESAFRLLELKADLDEVHF